MAFSRWLSIVVMLMALLGGLREAVAVEPVVQFLKLPVHAERSFFDEHSGSLLSCSYGGVVVVYTPRFLAGDPEAFVKPETMAFGIKQCAFGSIAGKRVILALAASESHIKVIDAEDFRLVRRIDIPNRTLSMMAAQPVGSKVVVFGIFTDKDNIARNGAIVVDIETGNVSAPQSNKLGLDGEVVFASFDGQGRQLWIQPYEKKGVMLSLEGDQLAPISLSMKRSTRFSQMFDQYSRFVIADQEVYEFGNSRATRKLGIRNACRSDVLPLFCAVVQADVILFSANSLEPVQRWKIESLRRTDRERTISDDTPKFVDGPNGRILFADGSWIATVPFAKPAEPFMAVRAPTSAHHVLAGVAHSWPIEKSDATMSVSLRSGPEGLQLTDSSFQWTPSADQVGVANVVLDLAWGQTRVTQAINLFVIRPRIELSFAPNQVVVNASGTRAIAWYSQPKQSGRIEAAGTKFACIDLQHSKVLSEGAATESLVSMAIDDKFAYGVGQGASNLQVFSTEDPKVVRMIGSDQPIISTRLEADSGYLFLRSARGISVFESSTNSVVAPNPKLSAALQWYRPGYSYQHYSSEAVIRVSEGWWCSGFVLSPSLEEITLIPAFPSGGMQNVVLPPGVIPDATSRARKEDPLGWNVALTDDVMQTRRGSVVLVAVNDSGGRRRYEILRDQPRGVVFYRTTVPTVESRIQLAAFDLVTGRSGTPLVINSTAETDQYSVASMGAMASGKGIVVVADGPYIYAVKQTELPSAETAEPLRFERRQSSLIVNATEPTTLTHSIAGGSPPFVFELVEAAPWLKVDAETGVVTVDGPAVLQTAALSWDAKRWNQLLAPLNWGTRSEDYADEKVSVLTSAAIAKERSSFLGQLFAATAGREASGVPVATNIRVRVRDSQNQTAELEYAVLMELPEGTLSEGAGKAIEQLRDRLKVVATPPAAVSKATASDDRVPGMLDRLERLEAQVELMIRLLEEKAKNRGSR